MESERLWLSECQSSLDAKPKYASWERQFNLFADDAGLIRCRGRLGNADLPYATKYLILLDSKHPVSELIVRDCHENVKHNEYERL